MVGEAFGRAALKKTQVYEWHKHFRDGRVSVHDEPRCRLL
jgi:hypothetical protein